MAQRLGALLLALAACGTPQPCPTPLEECSGQCVDLRSDRRHCGRCGAECAPGAACVLGECTSEQTAACAQRTGGAFVTLGACGDAVTLWVTDPSFIATAEAGVAAPDPALVPSLAVVASPDCDAQWSWHVAPRSASFVDAAIEPDLACSVCPRAIQADPGAFVAAIRTWCPRDARVLAVGRRPPP